ncbi:hypothetical protein [Methylobacterium gnaphalii]|uniref:Uncharacterized protein n=1 Tax=Methylobacterium gnaphalii TaxID=1010610 RepID=A0A512JG74_9HYPH|nr:hypothetical protein [Methylobacterium gnaphalii]GEP08951.1 hypothetical protein MGN01_07960 [Methylobacterium gnaphalii]GJD67493.1 hypothetical protein MMMDOFMJ_0408 [Methylobacterium gnaphalii]GLS48184.1 hypothetical protein GCM10007885_10280 [Methylobacterium gnaphalii]
MTTSLRITTLFLAAGFTGALGLTAAPPKAADGTLGRDRDVVDLSGAERWALRPTRVSAAANLVPASGARAQRLSELPAERRAVRVVYQGYFDAGAVSAAR